MAFILIRVGGFLGGGRGPRTIGRLRGSSNPPRRRGRRGGSAAPGWGGGGGRCARRLQDGGGGGPRGARGGVSGLVDPGLDGLRAPRGRLEEVAGAADAPLADAVSPRAAAPLAECYAGSVSDVVLEQVAHLAAELFVAEDGGEFAVVLD